MKYLYFLIIVLSALILGTHTITAEEFDENMAPVGQMNVDYFSTTYDTENAFAVSGNYVYIAGSGSDLYNECCLLTVNISDATNPTAVSYYRHTPYSEDECLRYERVIAQERKISASDFHQGNKEYRPLFVIAQGCPNGSYQYMLLILDINANPSFPCNICSLLASCDTILILRPLFAIFVGYHFCWI